MRNTVPDKWEITGKYMKKKQINGKVVRNYWEIIEK